MDHLFEEKGFFMIIAFVFFCMFSALHANSADEETFLRGNQLYMQEKYADAIKSYERMNNTSNAVWYNLGNCFYQQGDYLRAYAYWRKAAKTASGHQYQAIAANIRMAEKHLGKEPNFFDTTWSVVDSWSPLATQLLFLFFWCILLGLACAWYKKRRWLLLLILVFVALCAAGAVGLKYYRMHRQIGIITKDQAQIFTGPDTSYQSIAQLPHATEVAIVEQREQWIKIKDKHLKGWMAREDLLLI